MSKLDNKGQSLVIFIIFIPVFIMVGALVVDVSFARYNARRLDNVAKEAIRYGLNHIEEEPYNGIVELIYQNDNEIDDYKINVDDESKSITITLSKSTKGFFGIIVGKKIYKEKSTFIGYLKDDKKIIEKKVVK